VRLDQEDNGARLHWWFEFELTRIVGGPGVTHLRYRVLCQASEMGRAGLEPATKGL
jgi:hypothetical protein